MGQKIATGLFIVIQLAFIACALVVVSSPSPATPTTLVGAATFLVAYYTLGASSWRLLNVIFCRQKNPDDRKGMMDL